MFDVSSPPAAIPAGTKALVCIGTSGTLTGDSEIILVGLTFADETLMRFFLGLALRA
jgi:hypothetical protein